jgi:3-oxoacyl-[acyl-carrier-protein] synthase-3
VTEIRSFITGTGSYAPERVLSNLDLEKMVDTSYEWIFRRTGIRERRIAEDGVSMSDMAAEAGKVALKEAGLTADQLDMVVVGTVSPDYRLPSAASLVQEKLGATRAGSMDLSAGCASFIYALSAVDGMIRSGQCRRVLLVGSERLSAITNFRDRSTCILFGDGAGAVVMEAMEGEDSTGVMATVLATDGRYAELLWIPEGGSSSPYKADSTEEQRIWIEMDGSGIFRIGTRSMISASIEVCTKAGISIEDVSLFIPHQANIRIIEAVRRRLRIPNEKVFINVDRYGNTSSASVPLALDEAIRAGRVRSGDIVLMVAFGAGLAWGASLVKF